MGAAPKGQAAHSSGKLDSGVQVWSGTPPRGPKRRERESDKDDGRSGGWGSYASKRVDTSSGGYDNSKGRGRDGGKAGGGKKQRY